MDKTVTLTYMEQVEIVHLVRLERKRVETALKNSLGDQLIARDLEFQIGRLRGIENKLL